MFEPSAHRRLFLRKGRERAIANRHPWIFSGAIHREEGPDDAALCELVDSGGGVVASGFYSARSQIRLRALTFGNEPISAELLEGRIRRAIERRRPLLTEETNAVRLVNSEGDDLSGLVVDVYDDVLVVEIGSAGLDRLRDLVVEMLRRELAPRCLILHNDIPARKIEGLSLENAKIGDVPSEVIVSEAGRRFVVDLDGGQKTGFFLDQRPNRLLASSLARGGKVLNLFAYSGGFGVHALAGGAASVSEVDVSEKAINLARRNHDLNGSLGGAAFVVADAFQYTRELVASAERFALVVCDPPAFARSRKDIDKAARGYKDINIQAMKLVAEGGYLMTFSCSGHMSADLFQKVVFAAAFDAGLSVSILRRLGAGEDHPVSIYCPEGEYLKGFLLRVG